MKVIQFTITDRYYADLLVNLLKSIPYVKAVKDIEISKENEYKLCSENDLDTLSLFSINEIFNDLGSDEDYKEWINAPSL